MDIRLSPQQEAFRSEVRRYLAELLTPELTSDLNYESQGPVYRAVVKTLARDGWLGLGWPVEYGGQARSMVDELLFADEAARAGLTVPLSELYVVGPTFFQYGTDEQKQELVPRILNGDLSFAIGYTEPAAGSDLASLTTRAVRDGDEYVINGQKIFTSGAGNADYIWLAARTDPDAYKHRGLSVLMVPTSAPGFSLTPIHTIAGWSTFATYYNDVRVPVANLVGNENEGWPVITSQLNRERAVFFNAGTINRWLQLVRRWATEATPSTGRRPIDQQWVRIHLARVHACNEMVRLLSWKLATAFDSDTVDPAEASASKAYATELALDAAGLLLEVLGPAGYVKEGSPGALVGGEVEHAYRMATINTFGGGTNDVMRDLIASVGLGLPRPAR